MADLEWMLTYTGRAFYPTAPTVDTVDPVDIAHALSMICRYGGHVRRFYSVAEHCVLMSHAVPPVDALWALLHDATEAYVGDMVRPLKRAMPEYRRVEDRLMAVICERFGIEPAMPASVHAADTRILYDERDALLTPSPRPWASLEGFVPLGVEVQGWQPASAELRYLERLSELTHAGRKGHQSW